MRAKLVTSMLAVLAIGYASEGYAQDVQIHTDVVTECYAIGEHINDRNLKRPRDPYVSEKSYQKSITSGTRPWEKYMAVLPTELRAERLEFYRSKYPIRQEYSEAYKQKHSEAIKRASIACSNGEFWKVWPNADVMFDGPPPKTDGAERVILSLNALEKLIKVSSQ